MNTTLAAHMTVSDYVADLFPTFDDAQIEQVTSHYTKISTLATNVDKMAAIMGECTSCGLSFASSAIESES